MLRIVTGAFQPDLETALLEHLASLKQPDPFAPMAVVVPSTALRRRLQWLLSAEQDRAYLNLHLLTFHQLTRRLLRDAVRSEKPDRASTILFHELVRRSLQADHTHEADSAWRGLAEMPGAWAALWATCKDLKDAAVDPAVALEALDSREPAPPADVARMMRLYANVRETAAAAGARDPDDLAVSALPHVGSSAFLRSLVSLTYYGFYDLTQVQWDLFREITQHYPTTLFYPLLRGHPAFSFAERFFERYVHGLLRRPEDWTQRAALASRRGGGGLHALFAASDQAADSGSSATSDHSRPVMVEVVDAAGREDEITYVAKDILRLVEEAGYQFHEIGVVGRTLAGYESILPSLFHEQQIPFATTMTQSLAAHPLAHAALLFLEVKRTHYRRDLVIELLSSPYLNPAVLDGEELASRPDLWDLASRRAGIVCGLAEWRRLATYTETGLSLTGHRNDDEDEEHRLPAIPGAQIALLLRWLERLDKALSTVPVQATWAEYGLQLAGLWTDWLTPAEADAEIHLTPLLAALDDLACLAGPVTIEDLTITVQRAAQEARVPIAGQSERGVQALDAMTARGLPFRALYLVNMNERIFPRHIREDAFLRDGERRWLEVDLGYKVSEKLAGFEEEQLLFWLTANAATERLTVLSLRSDETGRPQIPSLYLDEVRAVCGEGLAPLSIPKRWAQRQTHPRLPQFRADWQSPRETAIGAGLARTSVGDAIVARLAGGELLKAGLTALRQLDSGRPALGDYDGLIGHAPALWQRLAQGMSPTALRSYGLCPFQYFARHVLRLRSIKEPDDIGDIPPAELGTLAHAILRDVHQIWHREGRAGTGWSGIDLPGSLARAAAPHFQDYAGTHPVGYPLLWELTQESLLAVLAAALHEDLDELRREGWQPMLFEFPVSADLPIRLPTGEETIHWDGRIDRIDWSASRKAYRILDYKYKLSRSAKTVETNLALAAVRGREWQPPLYLVMVEHLLQQATPADWPPAAQRGAGVWFYYLAPNWREDGAVLTPIEFPGDAWSGALGARLRAALEQILTNVRSGKFFIAPGGECDSCEARPLCRVHHQPSRWRARADHEQVEFHRRLRQATLTDKASLGADPVTPTVKRGRTASTRPSS